MYLYITITYALLYCVILYLDTVALLLCYLSTLVWLRAIMCICNSGCVLLQDISASICYYYIHVADSDTVAPLHPQGYVPRPPGDAWNLR